MTTYGITNRRLAIDGHVALVRCQVVGAGGTLTGKAMVFSVDDAAKLVADGAAFELWPWINGVRASRGAVTIAPDAGGVPRLTEVKPGGTTLASLPGF